MKAYTRNKPVMRCNISRRAENSNSCEWTVFRYGSMDELWSLYDGWEIGGRERAGVGEGSLLITAAVTQDIAENQRRRHSPIITLYRDENAKNGSLLGKWFIGARRTIWLSRNLITFRAYFAGNVLLCAPDSDGTFATFALQSPFVLK